MNTYFDLKKKRAMLQKWKKSEMCKALCAQEQAEYERILAKGLSYLQSIDRITSEAQKKTARVESAVGGNMHRGLYCPSPVLDMFVGGLKRGRILKRVTAASKITHKFGFDKHDQLVYVEETSQDGYMEYILRDTDVIFGITVDAEGYLSALSEECFADGKLQKYTYAEMASNAVETDCYKMYSEEYFYDEKGLASCERTEYIPMSQYISEKMLCTFERRDGFLRSYTAISQIWKQIDPDGTKEIRYTPGMIRKA